MQQIGDGIRLDQQPPRSNYCGKPAHHYIVIWEKKQWLCCEGYDRHMSLRGLLRYDGGWTGQVIGSDREQKVRSLVVAIDRQRLPS